MKFWISGLDLVTIEEQETFITSKIVSEQFDGVFP
ncbi:MAG: hypothetical protein CM15mP29_2140 [Alphaproteobacteria bacterium]|nr:MAG: hypothetical protein CM15mP29_2140 [Alphaproteobacteria bacterium]